KKIRDNPPNVVLTNPEMLHLSVLPHHETWAPLLASLRWVVIDEVHTYRGVLGSHMGMVLRRLRRVAAAWGADPTFIFCSATVGNPAELCRALTDLPVTAVTESGAPTSARHMLFINPLGSPSQAAILMLQSALARGLRTIVYCQSRKMTELIALWAAERSGEYMGRISAYRAGFLPEERRGIEARMATGELLAVISTSALELGIDIGGLDLCILVGYPGSVMATWQRGGRVGRAGRESAVALIAQEDALDQYFMRHPEDFFARPPENAVLNPHNPVILDRHLVCAAAELTLQADEPLLQAPEVLARVQALTAEGRLFELADGPGGEWATDRKRPQREVDLRGSGHTLHIESTGAGEGGKAIGAVIGMVDQVRALRETHPGAVYLHHGRTYVIQELDLAAGTVRAAPARVRYYTRVRGEKSTEILEVFDTKAVGACRVSLGRLKVTEQITGYEKRAVRGGRMLGITPLPDMPPLVFETEGLWFDIPDAVRREAEDKMLHFMGGIHAAEHAAIGIMPLLVLTDRNDLGGISTPMHPQTGGPAVFIYDGLPGGAGLARQGYAQAAELLAATLTNVRDCPCDLGCPSCVHSPKCGSGNRPIDKAACIFVLAGMLGEAYEPAACPPPPPRLTLTAAPEDPDMADAPCDQPAPAPVDPGRYGVLDIETRYSAADVGGWNRADRMGVSIAVLYDSGPDEYVAFTQDEIPALAERMADFDLMIGFNILRFDYAVLRGVHRFPWMRVPTLDLLASIHSRLGFRLKLDNLAQATLEVGKSADGLMALQWWKEGRMDLIESYCRQDVAVTRDLYRFGREHGHVLFTNKAGRKAKIPVDWAIFRPDAS
ncbi:MAG: Zn-binding domain-containing protein, partial [Desulfovibrionaceae bacterium]